MGFHTYTAIHVDGVETPECYSLLYPRPHSWLVSRYAINRITTIRHIDILILDLPILNARRSTLEGELATPRFRIR
jgi:hypothetical protein